MLAILHTIEETNFCSMSNKKNILLIGGTGFIGSQIKKTLISQDKLQNYHLKIISTKEHPSSKIDGLEYHTASLLDFNSLVEILQQDEVNIIIQCAQFPGHPVERPWLGSRYTYLGFDAFGTENIVRAIKHSKTEIEQYIYFSGTGLEEPALSHQSWIRAKAIAEKALQELPHTILRPSWIYGPGDQSMNKLIMLAKYLPFFPMFGNGSNRLNPIYIKDVAQIVINCLNNSSAMNQTIEIGGPSLTLKEIQQTILNSLKKNKPIFPHPKPLLKAAGIFAQFVPGSPLSPGSVDFICMNAPMSDPSAQIMDVNVRSLSDGLRDYACKESD